jgi:hypothetical protein
MFWSGYDKPTARRLLERAGFTIERARIETAAEDGKPVSFLWILARRLSSKPNCA